MLRFRTARSETDVLVREVESALGRCIAVSVLKDRPDDPDALDGAVTGLRAQADLLDGSDKPSDAAEVEAIEALETRVVDRKLDLLGIDPRQVRRGSLATLAHVGLTPSATGLPVVADAYAGRRRDADAAVDRVRALMAVLHAVHGAPAADVAGSLKSRGLVPWSTPQERTFLDLQGTREEGDRELAAHRAWIGRRVEGLHALGWALGMLDDLEPTGFSAVHPSAFAAVGPAEPAGAPTELLLRPQAELLARLDLLSCAHYAVQEHELRGASSPLPRDVIPGAIAERKRALEWLLGQDGWDDIEVDGEIRASRRR
ncbi:DUF4272 domain-containing protein [Patulibacter sp.]|uniref:DUF4272 domain-containing protein n=1 Tax=Patulibacter sp. TaxID=1912859 RepID=UPI002725595C|nr:DUF4272 domain-containing protein [Patulibacter sp.]MDO9410428.1 DUF4272 domain-containing protein [Patulibacter sp.]